MIGAILGLSPDLSLLIVDDNSPDGTGDKALELAEAEDRLHVMRRPGKLGLGSAYREGFARVLKQRDIKYVLEMDADFSHNPFMLPELIERAEQEGADLVIGSRYTRGGRIQGWSAKRLILSNCANRLCSLLLGSRVKDYTAGFRCYRAKSLKLIDFEAVRSTGFSFQVEMTFRMLKKGLRVSEVPIVFSERRSGSSKFDAGVFTEAAFVLGLLFMKRLVI